VRQQASALTGEKNIYIGGKKKKSERDERARDREERRKKDASGALSVR